MSEALVKELAIKLFKRFKFEPGYDDGLRIIPACNAWHIPIGQIANKVRRGHHKDCAQDRWLIFCPYLLNGGYEPLINLVERKIAANLDFFVNAAGVAYLGVNKVELKFNAWGWCSIKAEEDWFICRKLYDAVGNYFGVLVEHIPSGCDKKVIEVVDTVAQAAGLIESLIAGTSEKTH